MEDVKDLIENEFANFDLTYKLEKHKVTFQNLTQLKNYFKIECEFWEGENSNALAYVKTSNFSYHQRCEKLLESATHENYKELCQILKNDLTRQPLSLLPSNLPSTKFLIFEANQYPNRYQGCVSVLLDNSFGKKNQSFTINGKPEEFEYFLGVLDGYNYLREIVNRSDQEQQSDYKIFATYLSTISNIREQVYAHLNEMIDKKDVTYQEFDKLIENFQELINNSDTRIGNVLKTNDDQIKTKLDDLDEKIKSLNKLYTEKLRLESPAKYWDDFRITYENKGHFWRKSAMWGAGFLIGFMLITLYNLPAWLLMDNQSFYFKGLIIFSVIVSTFSYLIHLSTKLSTSAFHLARDAAERYQLTHVYLSLINENAIDKEDRQIILQALFSRADTGLLKHEGSPAFPDSFSTLLSKLKR